MTTWVHRDPNVSTTVEYRIERERHYHSWELVGACRALSELDDRLLAVHDEDKEAGRTGQRYRVMRVVTVRTEECVAFSRSSEA